jgi:nucleolar protein 15
MGQPRTKEEREKADQGVLGRQEERKRKIKEKGIDYEFEGHVGFP